MSKRFMCIWFRHLTTDWFIRRQPDLKGVPFVLAAPERGRMIIKGISLAAQDRGIAVGMVVADSRAVFPSLQVFEDKPGLPEKLLKALAEWCLRFTPVAAIDTPDGIILDISGCAHLWGGERAYLIDIVTRLRNYGYDVRAAIADTIGAAWAVSRFGQQTPIIESGGHTEALLPLPPAALRLDAGIIARMEKLGLHQIRSFVGMPRSALRRRFGPLLLLRLDHALGQAIEGIEPIQPVLPYQERLPSLEPIRTACGIEIAMRSLLQTLCQRLFRENVGLRKAVFKAFRVDGKLQQIEIGTNRPSRNVEHLFGLLELKISLLEPALGFELFLLEAPVVEDLTAEQEVLWNITGSQEESALAELLDRLAGKVGMNAIHRYLPQEHYWPERSVKIASSLLEKPQTLWKTDRPRPIHLLPRPEAIEVTAPIPDYPPMQFHYREKFYRIKKADGPERIEREWWLEQGISRDYYCVEDDAGARYWLFRLGHYSDSEPQWFIHGFFP